MATRQPVAPANIRIPLSFARVLVRRVDEHYQLSGVPERVRNGLFLIEMVLAISPEFADALRDLATLVPEPTTSALASGVSRRSKLVAMIVRRLRSRDRRIKSPPYTTTRPADIAQRMLEVHREVRCAFLDLVGSIADDMLPVAVAIAPLPSCIQTALAQRMK
jgi:hypothetical protein